ncbi:recombinase RecT [Acetobacter pomorum]|uniref:recombinase RecT n=1 Tax=Acetobacter pomorum TaxID=65959 RepID=UPI00126F1383|nr:recombinase RecT [Acetobacter pomorum]KAA8419974.1 recombinase RecT [Acetobacter pomorum]KAA8435524.1 recombinase RecT [Acetobacter pomorum]KAA8448343.1 recombinase RecT [Acetobacter pomorum]
MSNELITHTPVLQPNTFGELMAFAKMAAASDLMPKDYKGKPENIMIAVQMGSELGLAPMQAIQNIAVINGRPSIWGDAMLALVRGSGKCASVREYFEGEGDNTRAVCVVKRVDGDEVTGDFSIADAKRANLFGKQGPWQQYPRRMLQMRARGFALRDAFPDVLRGLISGEEAQDIPAKPVDVTPRQTQQRVAPPIDHIELFRNRLEKCDDIACVDSQWSLWQTTISRAQEAGRPISGEVQEAVQDMIAERREELDKQAAESSVDAVPA